jgi:hypothetical protein
MAEARNDVVVVVEMASFANAAPSAELVADRALGG